MDAILSAGIDFIVYVQALGTPASDALFTGLTRLGATGYLLLVPPVLWCFDDRLGVRIALALAVTLFVNTVLKDWIGLERPYLIDPRIVSEGESGLSMPSGHAQLVVVYWGLLAHRVQRPWFSAFAVAMMFLTGFSRVQLGVHYPSDVVVGWGIGALTAWVFVSAAPMLDAAWATTSPRRVASIIVAGAAIAMGFDAVAVGDDAHMNAGCVGFVLGASLGAMWTARRGVFTATGRAWRRLGRLALGLVMGMLLLRGMREVGVPDAPWAVQGVVLFDLALFGFWLTGAAPWVFEKTRLVTPSDFGRDLGRGLDRDVDVGGPV